MEFSYEMLESHILQNREIEFYYLNKKYSISNNGSGWFLTEYNNSAYQSYQTGKELLELGLIDGNHIKAIWNEVEIDVIF